MQQAVFPVLLCLSALSLSSSMKIIPLVILSALLDESPETRRRRKCAENMRMASPFDSAGGKGTMDFNELCALHKERVSYLFHKFLSTEFVLTRCNAFSFGFFISCI